MRTRRQFLTLLTIAAAGTGCEKKNEGARGFKIGYCFADLGAPYEKAMLHGAEEFAKENEFTILTRDAKGSAEEQARQVTEVVGQGITVVVIHPVDPTKLSAGLQKARDAGIYIVMLERTAPKEEIASLVDFNQELAGQLAADYLGQKLGGKGSVAILRSGETGEGERVNAFRKYLQEQGKSIAVASEETATGEGRAAADRLLKAHPTLSAIYATNDALARAAAEAIAASGSKAMVVCYGSEPETVDQIRKGGPLTMVTAGMPQQLGMAGARTAWRITSNEAMSPHLSMPVLPVVRENLDDYPGWEKKLPKTLEMPWQSDLDLKPKRE
jgi:ribose transport system substrate-binding protein